MLRFKGVVEYSLSLAIENIAITVRAWSSRVTSYLSRGPYTCIVEMTFGRMIPATVYLFSRSNFE